MIRPDADPPPLAIPGALFQRADLIRLVGTLPDAPDADELEIGSHYVGLTFKRLDTGRVFRLCLNAADACDLANALAPALDALGYGTDDEDDDS